jgi:transcriptional regulator with XRE-family HTH domain
MLTPNQIKAAELLSQGLSHQDVADACNVSRRTILRWLNQNDFKNLSFGLIHRHRQSPAQQAPQRPANVNSTNHRLDNLRVSDLIPDALKAVRDILQNPDARNGDKLAAASLIGKWSGLEVRGKLHELECVKTLIDQEWISEEVSAVIFDAKNELVEKIKNALGQQKSPPPDNSLLSDEGGFEFDDELDDE